MCKKIKKKTKFSPMSPESLLNPWRLNICHREESLMAAVVSSWTRFADILVTILHKCLEIFF